MIIGSEFNKKYFLILKEIVRLSENDTSKRIRVPEINKCVKFDRIEIKNVLEYLQEMKLINIETIGGPLLYGHVTITDQGLKKYSDLQDKQ